MKHVLLALLVLTPAVSGLTLTGFPRPSLASDAEPPADPAVEAPPAPVFSEPIIVDCVRAGGEPVVAIAPDGGILVAAHPGYTHFRRQEMDASASADAPLCSRALGAAKPVLPTQGESYMWRSDDGGRTFQPVTLPHAAASAAGAALPDVPNAGPRGVGFGVSDPDFTVDANGRIWYVEIPLFAGVGPSLSWSDDGGRTWVLGRPHAAETGMDRPWLSSSGGTAYLTGSAGRVFATDDGVLFRDVGAMPPGCNGDPLANPVTGALYISCGSGDFARAEFPGAAWNLTEHPLDVVSTSAHPEPALDATGVLYLAGLASDGRVDLARSTDDGLSWTTLGLDLLNAFPELDGGRVRWVRTSAGSEGRVAVTLLAAAPPAEGERLAWRVYNAIVIGAHAASPVVHATRLTTEPVHLGDMCTLFPCVYNQFGNLQSPGYDRRLGEFFETTVDRDGFLHVVYPDTRAHSADWVSHVGYVRLVDGLRLVEGPLPDGFPTQG